MARGPRPCRPGGPFPAPGRPGVGSFTGVREIVVEVDRGSVALTRAPGPVTDVMVTREWRTTEPRAAPDVPGAARSLTVDAGAGSVQINGTG